MANQRRACFIGLSCITVTLAPRVVEAQQFDTGSLIIPMDTTYQNMGMFRAYGLVYQLLLADIPVYWIIRSDKQFNEADFTASAINVRWDPLESTCRHASLSIL